MATVQMAPNFLSSLRIRLEQARARTDALFELLPPNSFYSRPIPERHRLIFYLGHVEAFDWNLLSPVFDLKPHDEGFDKLFAFGIDPVGGNLPTDRPGDWPSILHVERYNRRCRERLDERLHDSALTDADPRLVDGTLIQVAIEHRLMHAETLAYLFHNLPPERKVLYPGTKADPKPAPKPRQVSIPAGIATLGHAPGQACSFGWDNEFCEQKTFVPGFSIDVFPVTNAEFMRFLHAGGYDDSRYWSPEDWHWRLQQRLEHPHFWAPRSSSPATDRDTQWEYRTMFGTIPLPSSWPVYVSHAEASAFARWARKKLPTEAQWHRAAYGTPGGIERAYPWGDAQPSEGRGNFHFQRWDAAPVDAYPDGASAFGVFDLLGNGWEWTSSPFAPLEGFEPFPFYPGYSANFFDGKHFVLKGGSPRTDACMLRRSFRNWFQPHYPHIYSTFRCVED